jgi:hypothetical protein
MLASMTDTHRGRQLVMAFIAAVTCYLLAIVIARSLEGTGGLGDVVVFGFGAAFGLEFLWSAWPTLWSHGNRERIG